MRRCAILTIEIAECSPPGWQLLPAAPRGRSRPAPPWWPQRRMPWAQGIRPGQAEVPACLPTVPGLVVYCCIKARIDVPADCRDLSRFGKKCSRDLDFDDLEPVTSCSSGLGSGSERPDHVGIYAGSRQMIRASPTKGVVREDLTRSSLADRFAYMRRRILQ
ncbi:MAG: C40 family peptidase [Ignavibacteriales bacterium]|nr:C40 family peptidase [Ignavibacteriales bacterium]